jgi:hypothetical protein
LPFSSLARSSGGTAWYSIASTKTGDGKERGVMRNRERDESLQVKQVPEQKFWELLINIGSPDYGHVSFYKKSSRSIVFDFVCLSYFSIFNHFV